MTTPSVGLYLIAKNEAKRLPALLASCKGAFDQVVLVDTGSEDDTTKVFLAWCEHEKVDNPNFTYVLDTFEWCDDFAAARRYAQQHLTTEWEVWADCDDIIKGANNFRTLAAQASEQVMGYIIGYNYATISTGKCVCYLKRERLVRRGHSQWIHRVHEAQVIDGPVVEVSPEVIEYVHTKAQTTSDEEVDTDRNLRILTKWNEDEPNNTRVLAYLGTETLAKERLEEAMAHFHNYLGLNPEWDEERAQVHRKLAICYMKAGRFDEAIQCAFNALRVLPSWPDSYLTLAEAHYAKAEHVKAIEWAQESIRRGAPKTLLIVNPMDYSFQNHKILAGAYGELQQWENALDAGKRAWEANPGEPELANALNVWQGLVKRDHTATTFGQMCQQLLAHDEQLKALALLECVPHFAEDHPGIVNLRSELRERLAWVPNPRSLLEHYATGGSKPEDFLPDEDCDKVAASLPRVQFLYEGIHEQVLGAKHQEAIESASEQVNEFAEAMSGEQAPVE